MTQLKFGMLIGMLIWSFVGTFFSSQAGTISASLWINQQGQKVILLGDQHYPSQKNPHKECWFQQEKMQYKSFISTLQTIDNSSGVALLVENLTKLATPPHHSLLSLLSYSIYENPDLYHKVTAIHDLDEHKLRYKWASAIKDTRQEIMETTQDAWILQNVSNEDKCEYILDIFKDFFDTAEPLIDAHENSINNYIKYTTNPKTKEILQALLSNQTNLWNKIIDDYNTVNTYEESNNGETSNDDVDDNEMSDEDDNAQDTARQNLLSLFLSPSAAFYETNYYNKTDIISGAFSILDGLCECNALWHITKPNPAQTVIVIAGSAHIERLATYLDESGYNRIARIMKAKEASNHDYALINYDTSIKQWLLSQTEQLIKQTPREKKRKRHSEPVTSQQQTNSVTKKNKK